MEWDRVEKLKAARVAVEAEEASWQTYLRGLVASGQKGPFTSPSGEEKYIYRVKGNGLVLANKRTGPGKRKVADS